jgi:hypothetical protein
MRGKVAVVEETAGLGAVWGVDMVYRVEWVNG